MGRIGIRSDYTPLSTSYPNCRVVGRIDELERQAAARRIRNRETTVEEEILRLGPGYRKSCDVYGESGKRLIDFLKKKIEDPQNYKVVGSGYFFKSTEDNVYKSHPHDLLEGNRRMYYFVRRNRGGGSRRQPISRTAKDGYWKSSSKKVIKCRVLQEDVKLGMKHKFVFHTGKSPKGTMSQFVMHEYQLDDEQYPISTKKNDDYWVICEVFNDLRKIASKISEQAIVDCANACIDDGYDFSFDSDEITTTTLKKFQNIDEIFKFVGCSYSSSENRKGGNSSGRRWEALEPSKDIVKSELFMHQKLGLGWLIERENPEKLPPFWVKKKNKQGFVYKNFLMDEHETKEPPIPLRGGVFADDMGFGKTLTLISLISTDIRPASSSVVPSSSSSSSVSINTSDSDFNIENNLEQEERKEVSRKRTKESNEIAGSNKKRKEVDDSTVLLEGDEIDNKLGFRRKTTLIVCPACAISTWEKQLNEHTRPGTLKVLIYDDILHHDTIKVEDLQKYDIVLATCNDNLRPSVVYSRKFRYPSPILKMEWFRVILDDAHVMLIDGLGIWDYGLRNLKAKSRWVVTGMPILNGSYVLHGVFDFLRLKPFSDRNYWRTLVQLPIEKGNRNGVSRLQNIMSTISMRRLKGDFLVGLPPKTVETCFVELSAEDRMKYDQKEMDSQDVVHNFIRLGRAGGHYFSVHAAIQHLRQMCNDFASCPSEALASYSIDDVTKNPELLRKMLSKLRDGDYCDCPICYSPLSDPVITCCGHIFCKNCILKALSRGFLHYCPLCRYRLSKSDLFSSPPEEPCSNDGNKTANRLVSGGTAYSPKVSALLKLLVASKKENPAAKSVVFSQFKKMLILLEKPLKAAGFRTLILDGFMSDEKTDDVINKFKIRDSNSPVTTVLLVDIKALKGGMDLMAASRVYLFEPWLNPEIEEHAMDRVHRIGQEDVKIIRLIVRNSIEERILELHERKKNMDFGKNMNQRQVRNEELRVIMDLHRRFGTEQSQQTDLRDI